MFFSDFFKVLRCLLSCVNDMQGGAGDVEEIIVYVFHFIGIGSRFIHRSASDKNGSLISIKSIFFQRKNSPLPAVNVDIAEFGCYICVDVSAQLRVAMLVNRTD